MALKCTKTITLFSALIFAVAACISVNIDAPTGVDSGRQYDGAGAQ